MSFCPCCNQHFKCFAVLWVRRVDMEKESAFGRDENDTDKVTKTDNDNLNGDMTTTTMIPSRHMISYLRMIFIIMNMAQIVKT